MRCLGKDLRIIIFYECIKRKRKVKQNDDSQLSGERSLYKGNDEKVKVLLPVFALSFT